LIPYSLISLDVRHDLLELARFLTELSVIDYFFVVHRQSSVGLASLLFAMDEIPAVTEQVRKEFLLEIGKVALIDLESSHVQDCRDRLRLLYAQGGYGRMATTENRTETVSPVCVSYGCVPSNASASTNRSSSSDDLPSEQHPTKEIRG
jgi:hypothetical protein